MGANSAAALNLPVHQSHGIAAVPHTAWLPLYFRPNIKERKELCDTVNPQDSPQLRSHD